MNSNDPQNTPRGNEPSETPTPPQPPAPREIPVVPPTDRINLNDTIYDIRSIIKKNSDK